MTPLGVGLRPASSQRGRDVRGDLQDSACVVCDGDGYVDLLDSEGFDVIGPGPCPECCVPSDPFWDWSDE